VAGLSGSAVLPLHLDAVRVEGRPAEGEVRARVVWADPGTPFVRHVWQLLGLKGVEMRVRAGAPIPTRDHDRKELAQISHGAVSALGVAPQAA
jgi:hypothetical protein